MATEQRTHPLLARLWELQAEAGLSDSELARDLEVSASTICRLRNRQRGLGGRFIEVACARFPELRSFLGTELPTITRRVPMSTKQRVS